MSSFGMPTLIETQTLQDCVLLCRSLGLDFIELNMNLPQYQLPALNADHLRAVAEEYGLYFTIHLDENLNPADFNPHVAAAWRRTVLETIDLAQRLHTPILNMHLPRGVYFTLPDRKVYLFDQYREQYLASIRAFRDQCAACIDERGPVILIENTDGFLPFQMDAISLLLESPAFGLTLDVGHSHVAGGADESFILHHASSLRHMHLHDALGRSNHLPLGGGEVDLPNYLSLAESRGCRVVLETKTIEGLGQSASWLRSHGYLRSSASLHR